VRFRLGEFEQAGAAFAAARSLLGHDPLETARIGVKEAQIPYRFGRYPQALGRLTRALRLLDGVPGRAAAAHRARLFAWYGAIRFRQGRARESIAWCTASEREARAGRARDALAHAYLIHDVALAANGEVDKAVYGPRALAIYEELGDLARQASVLSNLGLVAWEQSRWDECLTLYRQAKEIWDSTGDRWNASFATYNIGELLSDQGVYDEAEQLLREALRVWRAAGSEPEIADALCQLGRLRARRGDFDGAWPLLEEARDEQNRIGERVAALTTETRIAEAYVLAGRAAEARELAEQTLERAAGVDGGGGLAPALHRVRGTALALEGRGDEAEAALVRALELARARDMHHETALALHALARARAARGADTAPLVAERDALLGRLHVVHAPELAGL
jgi:tetratricopeptide (TPR) repeat protein